MVTRAEADADPREHLGRDVFLNIHNDLVIDSRQDLAQIRYYDNLSQAILGRLRTHFGELELHTNYGCRLHELIGKNANDLTLSTAQMHVREALLQEPRVDEIESIAASFRDAIKTIVDIDIRVKPINSLNTLNLIYSLFI